MDAGWSGVFHLYSFWRLYYVAGPGAELVEPQKGGHAIHTIESGAVYLIPSMVRLFRHWAGRQSVQHAYVHFRLEDAFLWNGGCLMRRPLVRVAAEAVGHELQAWLTGWESGDCQDMQDLRAVRLITTSLLACLREEHWGRLAQRRADPQRIRLLPAFELLDRSEPPYPRIAELATSCGLGADRFSRLFKEVMSVPPQRYLVSLRVEAAARMLRETNDSIEEVAAATGFPNRYYFSRVFKQHVGIGPGEYRRTGGW